MKTPDHIEGLEGRSPIGAALTLGIKHQSRGFPVEKDRFHFVQPYEAEGRREHHPGFAFFNHGDVAKRRMVRGRLVHASQADCFEHHLKAQVLTKGHPNKRPACVGDGKTALRWQGGDAEDFVEIKCPHERCEYRLSTPPKCKPFMRFLFQPIWNDDRFPQPLVKFTSGSWNTVRNFIGFFDQIFEMVDDLKIPNFSLYGYPFTMTLVERTKPSAKSRFPTVAISGDKSPLEWLRDRQALLDAISGEDYTRLTDQSQQDYDTLYEDVQVISAPARKK